MTDSIASLSKLGNTAIRALKPYGPGPIVTVVLMIVGTVGLAKGVPPLSMIALVVVCFGAFFFTMERRHVWRQREIENEYDRLERKEALLARKRIMERIREKKIMMLGKPSPRQEIADGHDD